MELDTEIKYSLSWASEKNAESQMKIGHKTDVYLSNLTKHWPSGLPTTIKLQCYTNIYYLLQLSFLIPVSQMILASWYDNYLSLYRNPPLYFGQTRFVYEITTLLERPKLKIRQWFYLTNYITIQTTLFFLNLEAKVDTMYMLSRICVVRFQLISSHQSMIIICS